MTAGARAPRGLATMAAMPPRLRLAVIGAGSIGCYVGGRLLAADAAEVVFIGRPRIGAELAAHGLTLRDVDGAAPVVAAARITFATEVAAAADCDGVLCCVKSAQTEEVARDLAAVLRADAVIASLQNGVGNAAVLRAHLPGRTVLAGIVSFNVVSAGDGVFHRTMNGPLMFEAPPDAAARALTDALSATGLDVTLRADLAPDQWTKLIVNLNNAISALSGAPTRTLLLTPGYRRIIAAVVGEAIAVLRAARIKPARLRGVPIQLMPHVMRLPTPLVRVVTRAQMKVDAEARSSMWEDLSRGRPTEVDYLNGELVRLGARVGAATPLNARIVELIHAAEAQGPGSPALSPEALWAQLQPR